MTVLKCFDFKSNTKVLIGLCCPLFHSYKYYLILNSTIISYWHIFSSSVSFLKMGPCFIHCYNQIVAAPVFYYLIRTFKWMNFIRKVDNFQIFQVIFIGYWLMIWLNIYKVDLTNITIKTFCHQKVKRCL